MADPALLPRLVIAAPQGRSGKTTATLGLCAALAARGIPVQPFKKGPDYIDPSWLSEAAGRPCRSLDPFFLPETRQLRQAFLRGANPAGIAIIEGNHGLYDSLEDDGRGSTAAVARSLDAPLILVLNTARMARSAAAIVLGCQAFEPGTRIAGVILNNVAHKRHEARLREAIERHCKIPVVGVLPRDDSLAIPDRHLGLVPRGEGPGLLPALETCRRAAESGIDLDAVLGIARCEWKFAPAETFIRQGEPTRVEQPRPTIGVLRGSPFTFYYPENLEALEEAGARLLAVDALGEARLPPVDALYIGGGFPEMFMETLEANRSLRQDIRQAAAAGLPIYAECGGLMYLSRRLVWGSRSAEMCAALPFDVEMTARPQGHGYVLAEVCRDNPFFEPGTALRGHEFHHSRLSAAPGSLPAAYRLQLGSGLGGGLDGIVHGGILAAYTHLHALGSPAWAPALVAAARRASQ